MGRPRLSTAHIVRSFSFNEYSVVKQKTFVTIKTQCIRWQWQKKRTINTRSFTTNTTETVNQMNKNKPIVFAIAFFALANPVLLKLMGKYFCFLVLLLLFMFLTSARTHETVCAKKKLFQFHSNKFSRWYFNTSSEQWIRKYGINTLANHRCSIQWNCIRSRLVCVFDYGIDKFGRNWKQ